MVYFRKTSNRHTDGCPLRGENNYPSGILPSKGRLPDYPDQDPIRSMFFLYHKTSFRAK
jgi:hypothetical protein